MGKLVSIDTKKSPDAVREALQVVLKALDDGKPIRKVLVITEEVDPSDPSLALYDFAPSDLTVEQTLWMLEMARHRLFMS